MGKERRTIEVTGLRDCVVKAALVFGQQSLANAVSSRFYSAPVAMKHEEGLKGTDHPRNDEIRGQGQDSENK